MRIAAVSHWLFVALFLALLTACTSSSAAPSPTATPVAPLLTPKATLAETAAANACSATEPVWAKPPEDSAVQDPPAFGHYFVNPDRSIWVSAWWTQEAHYIRASEGGIKTGWFRPAGATLEVTGRRLDGQAPPLDAHFPCCYPTRFQAGGLVFPTEGCWEVTARAEESELSFVVWVEP